MTRDVLSSYASDCGVVGMKETTPISQPIPSLNNQLGNDIDSRITASWQMCNPILKMRSVCEFVRKKWCSHEGMRRWVRPERYNRTMKALAPMEIFSFSPDQLYRGWLIIHLGGNATRYILSKVVKHEVFFLANCKQ